MISTNDLVPSDNIFGLQDVEVEEEEHFPQIHPHQTCEEESPGETSRLKILSSLVVLMQNLSSILLGAECIDSRYYSLLAIRLCFFPEPVLQSSVGVASWKTSAMTRSGTSISITTKRSATSLTVIVTSSAMTSATISLVPITRPSLGSWLLPSLPTPVLPYLCPTSSSYHSLSLSSCWMNNGGEHQETKEWPSTWYCSITAYDIPFTHHKQIDWILIWKHKIPLIFFSFKVYIQKIALFVLIKRFAATLLCCWWIGCGLDMVQMMGWVAVISELSSHLRRPGFLQSGTK